MKLKDGEPEVYCTSYCNFGHYMKTGRPIDHECRIIPPRALRAELNGDVRLAIRIMEASAVRIVRGRKMKP